MAACKVGVQLHPQATSIDELRAATIAVPGTLTTAFLTLTLLLGKGLVAVAAFPQMRKGPGAIEAAPESWILVGLVWFLFI